MGKVWCGVAAGFAGAVLGVLAAHAQPALPPRVSWSEAGLMQGFPPPADKRITRETALVYPNTTWSYQHVRELFPTRTVARGGPVRPLATSARFRELDDLTFEDGAGATVSWPQFLDQTYTDAVLVIHDGRILEERYFNGMRPDSPHLLFSVTKSFVGLLAEMLIAESRLDENALATRYVPELAGTAWADVTVRDLLDMRDGVKFIEDYADPAADIGRHAASWGWVPLPPGVRAPQGVFEALPLLRERSGPRGGDFRYASAVTDTLGWVVARASGQSLSMLLSQRIWQGLGAEHDATWALDLGGQEIAAGGLNATLRDLGRFGELLRQDGRVGGQQVVSAAVMAKIRAGGDRAAAQAEMPATRAGWSYRSQYWISHDADGSFLLMGVAGQRIFINPAARLTIVKLGSHPVLANVPTDRIHFNAFAALAARVRR